MESENPNSLPLNDIKSITNFIIFFYKYKFYYVTFTN